MLSFCLNNFDVAFALLNSFSEKISKIGTQPIIGTQINFKHENEIGLLTLIAKNNVGYSQIIELSSKSYLDRTELEISHCKFEDLFVDTENILVMSGTINGLFGKLFNKGKLDDIENLYKLLLKKFKNHWVYMHIII